MPNKTQKLYTSRANNLDANTYIGEAGRIFYNEPTTTNTAPTLRYSDGVTPGGIPITTGGGVVLPEVIDGGYLYENNGGGITTLSFPLLPNYASDTAANTAIAGDSNTSPQRGQLYYNTATDKAMVYTSFGWQAMN